MYFNVQSISLAKNNILRSLHMFFPCLSVLLVYHHGFLLTLVLLVLLVLPISKDYYPDLNLILMALVQKNTAGRFLFANLDFLFLIFIILCLYKSSLTSFTCLIKIFRSFLIKRLVHNLNSPFYIGFRNHIRAILVPILPFVWLGSLRGEPHAILNILEFSFIASKIYLLSHECIPKALNPRESSKGS